MNVVRATDAPFANLWNRLFLKDAIAISAAHLNGHPSLRWGVCFSEGEIATPRFLQIIDLSVPETQLRSQIRKSYKSNWRTKSLKLRLLDHNTVAQEAMEEFRQLHVEVAGRDSQGSGWRAGYGGFIHSQQPPMLHLRWRAGAGTI